jgi:hypothetical protein
MTASKIVAAAASGVGGAGLDVDDVFSTTVYEGTGASRSITNGIDLSGEGGLVWTKSRDSTYNHTLGDTANGVNKYLYSNTNADIDTSSAYYSAFNTDGYVIGDAAQGFNANELNASSVDYVSWTFRKAPKFFDVVTYTGNGTAGKTVAHNLGSVPGMIIFKKTSADENWAVYHRGANGGTDPEDYRLELNENFAQSNRDGFLYDTAPTATHFTVGDGALSNTNGATYVAYLFAHNNNDGGFGPDSDQDIIKCGTYTGNGVDDGPTINLGFEPQFFMFKKTSGTGNWFVYDVMRGFTDNSGPYLVWNDSAAEATSNRLNPTSTGVKIHDSNDSWNESGATFIYMAIRRGPLAQPEDATKVFSVNTSGTGDSPTNAWNIGFNADFNINTKTDGSATYLINRLTNGYLHGHDAANEVTGSSAKWFTSQSNILDLNTSWWGVGSNVISYSWKRAPGYFDMVAYTGTGSARTVSHNLGVVPEMMWVKCRSAATNWGVYTGDNTDYMILSTDSASADNAGFWNDTSPTSSVFTLGSENDVNKVDRTYIAHLFATVAGVSKVGSYSGNGGTQNIDCGFSSGARFVLIKRTDTSGEGWKVHDSIRGIVAGNDPFIELNTTNAQNSSFDLVDPYSGGFAVNNYSGWNASGGTYLFYAVA